MDTVGRVVGLRCELGPAWGRWAIGRRRRDSDDLGMVDRLLAALPDTDVGMYREDHTLRWRCTYVCVVGECDGCRVCASCPTRGSYFNFFG